MRRSTFTGLALLASLTACSPDEFSSADAGGDAAPLDAPVDRAPIDGASDGGPDVDAGPKTFCTTDPSAQGAATCLDFDLLDDKSPLAFAGWTSLITPINGLDKLFTPADSFHDGGSPSKPNHLWLRFLSGGSDAAGARGARKLFKVAALPSTIRLDFELRVADAPNASDACTYATLGGFKGATSAFGLSLDRSTSGFSLFVIDSGGPFPKALGPALGSGWHHVALSATKGNPGAYSIRVDQDAPIQGTADFGAVIDEWGVAIGVVNTTPVTSTTVEQNGFYDNVVVRTSP